MPTDELFNIINNHFIFMEHKFALNSIMKDEEISKIFYSHVSFFNQSIEYSKNLKLFNQYDDFTVSLDNKNDKMDTSKKFIIKTSDNDSITIHSLSSIDITSRNNLNKYDSSLDISFIIRKDNQVIEVLKLNFKHTDQDDKIINTVDLSLGTSIDNFVWIQTIKNHNDIIESINICDCLILNDSKLTISSFEKDKIPHAHIFETLNESSIKEAIIYGGLDQNTTDILALTKDMSGLADYVVIDKKRTVFDMISNNSLLSSNKNNKKIK